MSPRGLFFFFFFSLPASKTISSTLVTLPYSLHSLVSHSSFSPFLPSTPSDPSFFLSLIPFLLNLSCHPFSILLCPKLSLFSHPFGLISPPDQNKIRVLSSMPLPPSLLPLLLILCTSPSPCSPAHSTRIGVLSLFEVVWVGPDSLKLICSSTSSLVLRLYWVILGVESTEFTKTGYFWLD